MKKGLLILMVLPLLFLTGCGQLLSAWGAKDDDTASNDEQRAAQEPAPPTPQPTAPPVEDKTVTVDGVKIFTDNRNWVSSMGADGEYEIFPNGKHFDEGLEGILLMTEDTPLPNMDKQEATEAIKQLFIQGFTSESDGDVSLDPISVSSNNYVYKLSVKNQLFKAAGYLRFFGNENKMVFIVYLNGKHGFDDTQMQKWEERIKKAEIVY